MTTTPAWLEADLGIEGVHIRVTTRAGASVSRPGAVRIWVIMWAILRSMSPKTGSACRMRYPSDALTGSDRSMGHGSTGG